MVMQLIMRKLHIMIKLEEVYLRVDKFTYVGWKESMCSS